MTDKLSTDSYKGVRDFYPEDMAVQRYIFDTWSKTAESFGFERYDASILEPSDLYKAKGAENEELVNEQTYTFTDRGSREVTLRPEMTPTVARMVAAKARELAFPLRWYSIPNLFRYERPQKGRLREHWQFNCDIFGADHFTADVEIIALAYQTMIDFGAKPGDFEIRINNRQLMTDFFANRYGIVDPEIITQVNRTLDKRRKVTKAEFDGLLKEIVQDEYEKLRDELDLNVEEFVTLLNTERNHSTLINVKNGLEQLEIKNVVFDASLARGFDYYTGTIFEIFELDSEGKSTGRSMLGGGRYDNLTGMFGGEPVSGIGFGMGDVTMRDFLETHDLLPGHLKSTATQVVIIPITAEENLYAEKVAHRIRQTGISVSTDIGTQKADKKKARATDRGAKFITIVGEEEMKSETLTIKNIVSGEEKTAQLEEILNFLTTE
ncbi:MAG: histidyl-tRNA synthetase [Candidatus Paceibacteria bacterium]|jgi:histidyl-tRNA synthetase